MRGLSPVHCPSIVRKATITCATRRTRVASARAAPPHQEVASSVAGPRVPPESRLRKEEDAARTSHHGLAPKERGLSLVQRPCAIYEPTTTSTARRARAARFRAAPLPQRQRAQLGINEAVPRVPRESRLRKEEAAASTSHHGLATKERGLLPMQCPSIAHASTTSSAVRRARAASSSSALIHKQALGLPLRQQILLCLLRKIVIYRLDLTDLQEGYCPIN